MNILTFSLGQLQANCYFLCQKNKDLLIIDPGDEAEFIIEKINSGGWHPKALVATHGHFDHTGAAGITQQYFDIPFLIDKKDIFLLKKARKEAEFFLSQTKLFVFPKNINNFEESLARKILEGFGLKVLKTPGHTPGSVCLLDKQRKILFTGDTIFSKGIGRFDFPYSSKVLLKDSLRKIFKLPQETTIYPGHGPTTRLGSEIEYINSLGFL